MNNQRQTTIVSVPKRLPPTKLRLVGLRFGAALVAVSLLSGCADGNTGNKEAIGTGVGAALGGLAGSFIGRGNTRIVGGLLGATVGGVVGNRIGAALDDRDRAALAAQSQAVLLSQPDDTQASWNSDHSDATATFVAANSRVETRSIEVVRDARVLPSADLDIIGRSYQARTGTRVHLAPSAESDVAGSLTAGESITAVGHVRGAPWIAVARGGRTIGYVGDTTIGLPARQATAMAAASPKAGFDLDAAAPVRKVADLDAVAPNTKVDRVTAAVPCRDVKTTLTTQGKSETISQSACKSPDGTWELL
jgi:surface antigen